MANNNFFSDPDPKDPEDQKFTIGDKEYTQDELNDLVAKGNQYNDIETKFNTKLEKVVPDYTRASQEAADLKKKLSAFEVEKADWERQQLEQKQAAGQQLTPDEMARKVRDDAVKFGLMTDETTPALIRAEIEGYELRKDTEGVVGELEDMGIKTDRQILLRYMEATQNTDNPINSPVDAAQALFGPQIQAWKEKEVKDQQADDWQTQHGGNAGATRSPSGIKVDRNTSESDLLKTFREAAGIND